jgi:hypothetical protein
MLTYKIHKFAHTVSKPFFTSFFNVGQKDIF